MRGISRLQGRAVLEVLDRGSGNKIPGARRIKAFNQNGGRVMKFYLGHKENFPHIGAQLMDDGEVLLTFNSFPASSMMAVPLNVAVDFAKHILDLKKEADEDFLCMIDESNFAQERE
jgi:hypothetical protein